MTDQYTEISFNSGETLKASQLNTVVQNINIVNTQVKNINTSINEINTAIAGKADKPTGNENYATVTYVNNSIAEIPKTDLSNYYTKSETDNEINAAKPDLSSYATETYVNTKVAAITTGSIGAAKASDLTTLQTNFANLQTSLNLSGGDFNQFAVSDGNGHITWLTIPLAENTTY